MSGILLHLAVKFKISCFSYCDRPTCVGLQHSLSRSRYNYDSLWVNGDTFVVGILIVVRVLFPLFGRKKHLHIRLMNQIGYKLARDICVHVKQEDEEVKSWKTGTNHLQSAEFLLNSLSLVPSLGGCLWMKLTIWGKTKLSSCAASNNWTARLSVRLHDCNVW